MKITNIYDFLHLLSLIKIRPNMDFVGGGGIGHNTFSFFPSKRMEKGSQTKTKIKGKKHIVASILFVFI
jgi:hypothetical protein